MAIDDDGVDRERKRKATSNLDEHGSDTDEDPATAGPALSASLERWNAPTAGETADPLDEMISGMVKGTLIQPEEELAEEASLLDESQVNGLKKNLKLGGLDGVPPQPAFVSSSDVGMAMFITERQRICSQKSKSTEL
jgi:hypothetical protein